jgi:DNA-binding PadR family transcriptional regulator
MASTVDRALSLLPLTPAVFHLLLALADGPLHGYAIAKAVAAHTGNDVRLGPGTLYGTLNRMAEAELVRELVRPATRSSKEDDRRRVYELTPLGRAVARAEARRMAALVSVARGKSLLDMPAAHRGTRGHK